MMKGHLLARIPAGQTESEPVDLCGFMLTSVVIPKPWTSGGLAIRVSPDGVTYSDPQTWVPATGGERIIVDPDEFGGVRRLMVVSSVPQEAERAVRLDVVILFELPPESYGPPGPK